MKRAVLIALVIAGCGGEKAAEREAKTCLPSDGHVESVEPALAGAPNRVQMGPGMELKATKRNLAAAAIGKPLVVTGVVTGTNCEPLAGATVHAWQTNGNGRYGPTRDGEDRCCFLTATMRTDEYGRYSFASVMPKGYDGGPAHIHFQAGHPEAQGVTTELVLDAPVAQVEHDIVLRAR